MTEPLLVKPKYLEEKSLSHLKMLNVVFTKVFKETPAGVRKIVVATNSAETSITIPGIRIVIDSGLAKEPSFDPVRNMTSLDIKLVSRSSAEQRAGRAGTTRFFKTMDHSSSID